MPMVRLQTVPRYLPSITELLGGVCFLKQSQREDESQPAATQPRSSPQGVPGGQEAHPAGLDKGKVSILDLKDEGLQKR